MTNHFFVNLNILQFVTTYIYFDVEHGIGPETEYQITLFKTVNV